MKHDAFHLVRALVERPSVFRIQCAIPSVIEPHDVPEDELAVVVGHLSIVLRNARLKNSIEFPNRVIINDDIMNKNFPQKSRHSSLRC